MQFHRSSTNLSFEYDWEYFLNMLKNNPPRLITLVIADSAALLILFAFIALAAYPQGQAFVKSVFSAPESAPAPSIGSASPDANAQTPAPTPTPTTEPTPSPAPGDFSESFEKADLAEGMDYVYRAEDYLIGIEEYYVDEAVVLVADVYVRDVHLIKTAFSFSQFKGSASKYEFITDLCMDNNAVFGVSGDFVSVREDGLIIRNGTLLQKNKYADICVLYVDGTLAVYKWREKTLKELTDGSVWQTWCFGPNLLDENGGAMEINHNLMRKNPRCAIGYYSPGHYAFVIVDGRQKYYSTGMTLTELSAFMAQLGCKVAYNLDGGMTAQMVLEDNVVNQPASGGRRVGDIIYIERTETPE